MQSKSHLHMAELFGLVQLATMQKCDSKWTRDQQRQRVFVYIHICTTTRHFPYSVHLSEH